MVNKERNKNGQGAKRPRLKYFFLNGDLHIKLSINRPKDLLVAWNYPRNKRVSYTYSDVLRRHERAFKTSEVCKMINRGRTTLTLLMLDGTIERPQHAYTLDENRRISQYMWSEKEIMALLEYFSTVHRGRPRTDGEQTAAANLPTPRELRALIHDEAILYIKQGDSFVPSWKAKEI